ncbi:MAG: potassium channel family protein, partial [Leptodesmis sp.]|uniref:potassium channel family protein n=1 Tax=Leptodesmis sp. TaxID=3100501 RepID=UPI003D107D45
AFRSLSEANKQANLIYFSFTTLTTTGYGDIVPISTLARAFANVEAIIGVMYPAIFIARLVGLYSTQQHKE